MPKLGVFSGEEVCRLLEAEGFVRIRQRGSHIVLQRMSQGITTTVPVPNHRVVRIGTLQAIIRQSGLPREKFVR
jgi:predicted RNA binding protein YcfA (HicA-like mRNA interferase family)